MGVPQMVYWGTFGDAFPYPFGIDTYSSLVYDARTSPYTSSYYCVSLLSYELTTTLL